MKKLSENEIINIFQTKLGNKKFISDKPFKISSCDKNIGVAIISNNIHKDLCNLHLDNLDNFQKLVENPLNATQKIIENKLIQKATFRPLGLKGRFYWYSVLPFHGFIFNGMIKKITEYKKD